MDRGKDLVDLSRAEYDILRILWKGGVMTVREAHDRLQKTYGWAYTTTKTMMDRMVSKGYLSRRTFHGVYLYEPLITRPRGMAKMVQFFAERVLETDVNAVVTMFAQSQTLTPAEIDELSRLLKSSAEDENTDDS